MFYGTISECTLMYLCSILSVFKYRLVFSLAIPVVVLVFVFFWGGEIKVLSFNLQDLDWGNRFKAMQIIHQNNHLR